MDNLNTHSAGALYQAFPPPQAKALWDRFDFVYTLKHGSWLNVAQIELNVMIRQCLNRRIDNIEELRDEVAAWQAGRDRLQAKVDWQFTTEDARIKLKRLYPTFEDRLLSTPFTPHNVLQLFFLSYQKLTGWHAVCNRTGRNGGPGSYETLQKRDTDNTDCRPRSLWRQYVYERVATAKCPDLN